MRLGFILGEFGTGVRKNIAMAVSLALVTFVSLTFVGVAMLLQHQIENLKGYWYDKVEVSIFLCTDDSTNAPTCASGKASESQKQQIESTLNSDALSPYVEKVMYESQEEAYARFLEMNDQNDLKEVLPKDALPESFRVKLKDPEKYPVVAEQFTGTQGVESVQDQREILEPLFNFLNRMTLIASIIAGVMVIAAVLLINTTIRLSAFNRRREVGIMRLVGASSVVIQLPFLLEGIFAACVGALLASGGLWAFLGSGGVRWLMGNANMTYAGGSAMVYIVPTLFGIAIVLAAVSSAVSLSRYLKV